MAQVDDSNITPTEQWGRQVISDWDAEANAAPVRMAQAAPSSQSPRAFVDPFADNNDPRAWGAVLVQPAQPAKFIDPFADDPTTWGAIRVQPPSVAADVAKSGGIGLAKGAIDFAGLPGDLTNLGAKGIEKASDFVNDALGLQRYQRPSTPSVLENIPTAASLQKNIEGATGEFYQPQTRAGRYAGTIGEFAGNPASYFGPGSLWMKALLAGVSGAGSEAAGQAAEGTDYEGAARFAGALAAPMAATAAAPRLSAQQAMLASRGVSEMTPGQLIGGYGKNLEDLASSAPILGYFVNKARGRSIESFNKAVGNQALEPIGARLDPGTAAGHDAVAEVEQKLGDAYDSVIPRLVYIPDAQFGGDLLRIRNRVDMLPDDQIRQFERIIDQRLGAPAPMHGRLYKDIESELNQQASGYSSSADHAQRELGYALGDVVRSMKMTLERSNPGEAEFLQRVNQGWAMYARMRDAAARRATSEGVFTPNDLLQAVKRGDKSVGKGSFARGDALMQDFAEAGQAVLPSKVPDSGTAQRLGMEALVGGYISPHALAGAAAASVPYMGPVTRGINRYISSAGPVRRAIAQPGRGAGLARPFLQVNPFATQNQ